MRCPDCNKFVSFDEPQAEVESEELSNGELSIDVRVSLSCAECGTELKEATLNLTKEVECPVCGTNEGLEIEETDATGQEIYEDAYGRNGRKLKNPNKFYGAEVTAKIHCEKCEHTFDVTEIIRESPECFEECC